MSTEAQAIYFPVQQTPLVMQAGLHPLGTDFGNGEIDEKFFQVDRHRRHYRAAKKRVSPARSALLATPGALPGVHGRITDWIENRWNQEHPDRNPLHLQRRSLAEDYATIATHLQEDFAVLGRDPSSGREVALAVYVSFPSAWRPERIVGRSFARIHDPVPGFADDERQASSLMSSMIDRGPYVRFVWTLSPDGYLDHHPQSPPRPGWSRERGGWLRVERQVTRGFPKEGAALFLIRTYLYPFAELSAEQRATLHRAVQSLPAEIAHYKGLSGRPRGIALSLLVD